MDLLSDPTTFIASKSTEKSLYNIRPINVKFSDISLTVASGIIHKEKKKVLKGVSGHFRAGELSAIMGPSGAGKSSLLRVLTGFIKTGVQGNISYNGSKGSKMRRKDTCYIMQEDWLSPLFSVYEIMMISSSLKLGHNISEKAKQILIEDILDMMGLSECKDTRCARLSGGQMKRLSISLELIDNPPVMFLDEPTTGLDSSSSLQCAKVLKSLAKGGRTIVCTIHQPCASIMDLFDYIYLLSDGECVYQGSSQNILPYLKQFQLECPKYHNPSDFIMEVVCGDYGSYHSQLTAAAKDDMWKKSKPTGTQAVNPDDERESKDNKKALVSLKSPSEYHRFWILLKCYYVQLYRDWTISHLKAVLHVVSACVIGALFLDCGNNGARSVSNFSYLYSSIVYLSYTTLMPAIMKIPFEKEIVAKEQFNNWYHLRTYFISSAICSLPIHAFFCIIHLSLSYYISGQLLEWDRFAMVIIICFGCTIASESFGLFFGALFEPLTGLFFGSLYIASTLVFGGFLIRIIHMHKYLKWIVYIDYYHYTFDGLLSSIYGHGREKLPCPDDVMYCHLSDPNYIIKELSVTEEKYWLDVGVLVLMAIGMRIVTYFCLKRKLSA